MIILAATERARGVCALVTVTAMAVNLRGREVFSVADVCSSLPGDLWPLLLLFARLEEANPQPGSLSRLSSG